MHQRKGSKKRTISSKRNYKRAGLSFVFIGLIIGSLGGILFWQQVDALSSKGWTFVGLASQYQDKDASLENTLPKRTIVNVYACKQSVGKQDGLVERYTVKAYATGVHNSVDSSYASPRLEILARENNLQRYGASAAATLPLASSAQIQAPFTDKSFTADTELYYGFNNYYQTLANGEAQYAIGSIGKLINC